jgi:hypothetical protein
LGNRQFERERDNEKREMIKMTSDAKGSTDKCGLSNFRLSLRGTNTLQGPNSDLENADVLQEEYIGINWLLSIS